VSQSDRAARCRKWIDDQLEQLGNLRNANPRDPSFKLWRQNTLTVLQRIWPGDPQRSERFRRIPFSPPSQKADGKAIRDWFGRGCSETVEYLQGLIAEIDATGVPAVDEAAAASNVTTGTGHDDDFPVLDLQDSGAATAIGETAAHGYEAEELTLGAEPAPSAPAPAASDEASPPSLKIDIKAFGASLGMARKSSQKPPALPGPPAAPASLPPLAEPPVAATPPAATAPPAATPPAATPPAATPPAAAAPPAAPPAPPVERAATAGHARPRPAAPREPSVTKKPARSTRARKQNPRMKLKDMLGLNVLETHAAEPAAPAPRAPQPVAAEPPAAAPPPPPPAPVAATPPPPPPAPATRPAPAPVAATPPPPPPVPAPRPAPEPVEPIYDPETLARATADFLRNSPVLGLQGRPVQRVGDATQYQDPDAVAVATLAADVGRLGVPELSRSTVRDALITLAGQLETGAVRWETLRLAVALTMESPELARRFLPILLPWLERAA